MVAVGIFLAVVMAVFLAWLGTAVVQGRTGPFDMWGRSAVHQMTSPLLTTLMRAASRYGAPRYLTPLMLLLGVGFIVRGWPRGGVLVLVTLVGAGVLDRVLKAAFDRVRPTPFFEDYPLPGSPSFPSGHALFATCVFGGLAVIATSRLRRRTTRFAVWVVATLMIALIGISRVYLGVHYPTDVLAGYLVGGVWVAAVAAGDRLVRHRAMRRRGPREPFRSKTA